MDNLDVFICHTWEDKEAVVNLLALLLREKGVRVRYEAWALEPGDNLRERIDVGLARSRYGIVVLSSNFFRREWSREELDLLAGLERDGVSVILPVLHRLSKSDVAAHSVPLAERPSWTTDAGVPKLAKQLVQVFGAPPPAA